MTKVQDANKRNLRFKQVLSFVNNVEMSVT